MGQILVRGLDDDVKERLRAIAAERGSSLEALVRDLLCEAATKGGGPEEGLGTRVARRFAGVGLTPDEVEDLELRGWSARIPDFEGPEFDHFDQAE